MGVGLRGRRCDVSPRSSRRPLLSRNIPLDLFHGSCNIATSVAVFQDIGF
jgi:hypothetical protein